MRTLRNIYETYLTKPKRDCVSQPSSGLHKVCKWYIIVSSTDCDLHYSTSTPALRHIYAWNLFEHNYASRPSSGLYKVCKWCIIVSNTDCDLHYLASICALRHIHEMRLTKPERKCTLQGSSGLHKVCKWYIIVSNTDFDIHYIASAPALQHTHEIHSTKTRARTRLTTFKRLIANNPRYVPVWNTSIHGNSITFFTTRDKALLITLVHLTGRLPWFSEHFLHVKVFIDYYIILNIILSIKFAHVTAGLQPQLSHFYADSL